MRELISLLSGAGPAWTYPMMGLFAFLESAAFVGLVIPGETAMLLGGVLAGSGQVSLAGMVAGGVIGAVLGDLAGYGTGRLAGPTLRSGRLGRWVGEDRWDRAESLLEHRGGPAVFLARWVGVLRAVVPAAAGAV
ncbi:MAG: rane-associated protein, partial [Pseudonocardiales bacterium]|nr:rane-associated protein [Pseudonocardiales bacterium]